MSIFDYVVSDAIGVVYSVDTSTVLISVTNVESLRSTQVNNLVAIQSSKAGQHLIGLINKITRKINAKIPDPELEEECADPDSLVENVMRVLLIGTMIDLDGKKPNVFRRTLETVPEIDAKCFVLNGERLTNFMKSISENTSDNVAPLRLGRYTIDEGAEAFLDGNKFFQRHAVIVGSTGSGKSCTTAHLLEQVASLKNCNAIVFDIHGEYAPIIGDGIQHLRVANPGDLDGDAGLSDGVLFLPYWLLTYEEIMSMLVDRSDQNAPNQAMVFSREIKRAKRDFLKANGEKEVFANFTVDSPVPYPIASVLSKLIELNEERVPGARAGTDKGGPFFDKLIRFIQRLEAKMQDRRLGFLFPKNEAYQDYAWMDELCKTLLGGNSQQEEGGVKIIDFSDVPSDILPLVVGLVARVIFYVQQWMEREKRHPISLICDEAHLYIPARSEAKAVDEAALNSFERIAKEGRKYGVGLVIISQRPSEVNRTVLSQCNNFIAMRLTNAEDQGVIKRLLPDSLGGFAELLPVLDIGEALVVGDATMLPARIHVDLPQKEPSSATVDFWDKWSEEETEDGISGAVKALRQQSRS